MDIKKLEFIIIFLLMIPTVIALVKGAPFVPTPLKTVRRMLELGRLKRNEKVYDIGCGDGRIVHLASKEYKANAIGFELSPLIYIIAKICQPFWRSHAKIRFRDFRFQNFHDADAIFCYLMPATLKKIQKKWEKELRNGTRVISYAFPIGNWKPTHKEDSIPEKNQAPIWVYEIGKHQ